MSDILQDRERGEEEAYFNVKNEEAIQKLREKMKVAAAAKTAGTSSMLCPRCGGSLKESKVDGVSIDTCQKCAGVWLDSGELNQLLRRNDGGWIGRLLGSSEYCE